MNLLINEFQNNPAKINMFQNRFKYPVGHTIPKTEAKSISLLQKGVDKENSIQ